jgi:hypothetical protein
MELLSLVLLSYVLLQNDCDKLRLKYITFYRSSEKNSSHVEIGQATSSTGDAINTSTCTHMPLPVTLSKPEAVLFNIRFRTLPKELFVCSMYRK